MLSNEVPYDRAMALEGLLAGGDDGLEAKPLPMLRLARRGLSHWVLPHAKPEEVKPDVSR
jgi:hypothetical protein